MRGIVIAVVLLVTVPLTLASEWRWELPPGFPPPVVPKENPMTAEKVLLGRQLFFDGRLSANLTQSCASCHDPSLAFTDGKPRAVGSTGETHPRSTMSLLNVAYSTNLTWQDETISTLEQQALVPMLNRNPVELGLYGKEALVVERFSNDPSMRSLFVNAFPKLDQPISFDTIAKALASFQRTLIGGDTPYFRWIYGDDSSALSDAAKRGAKLFFSDDLRCSTCHVGFTFSGPIRAEGLEEIEPAFHNTGLYDIDGKGSYPRESPGVNHEGRFRAPTLINISRTAPYMHDGSIATLSEVLDFYAAGGRGAGKTNRFKSERIQGFELTRDQREELLLFLSSLSGPSGSHGAE
jgi:cytochrome c peroxidase